MVTIRDKGPVLNEADVSAFEAKYGIALPDDYRAFLLENDGGRPDPYELDIEGFPEKGTDVQNFFGIYDNEYESCTLGWNADLYLELIEKFDLLPIACDSFGDLFCLVLSEEERGAIYFCSFDEQRIDAFLVGKDIQDFLGKLSRFDE